MIWGCQCCSNRATTPSDTQVKYWMPAWVQDIRYLALRLVSWYSCICVSGSSLLKFLLIYVQKSIHGLVLCILSTFHGFYLRISCVFFSHVFDSKIMDSPFVFVPSSHWHCNEPENTILSDVRICLSCAHASSCLFCSYVFAWDPRFIVSSMTQRRHKFSCQRGMCTYAPVFVHKLGSQRDRPSHQTHSFGLVTRPVRLHEHRSRYRTWVYVHWT